MPLRPGAPRLPDGLERLATTEHHHSGQRPADRPLPCEHRADGLRLPLEFAEPRVGRVRALDPGGLVGTDLAGLADDADAPRRYGPGKRHDRHRNIALEVSQTDRFPSRINRDFITRDNQIMIALALRE
jgi:hypothetical protein